MCLKANGFCLFFIYIVSLPAGGWCEAPPPGPRTQTQTQTQPSGDGGPEPGPRQREVCGRGDVRRVFPGTFHTTGQLKADPRGDARADPGRVRGAQGGRRPQPAVACGDDAMTLTLRRRPAELLRLRRVNASSVPWSRPPPRCGFSVQTTDAFLSLRTRYDGCHVTQEGDRRVLRLLWGGAAAEASCPVPRTRPGAAGLSALCCPASGFRVSVRGRPAEELRVNAGGRWTPLGQLDERCGFTLDGRRAHVVVTAPFSACGVSVEDGKRTLSLQSGDDAFALSCPTAPARKPVRELRAAPSLAPPSAWIPPFYLAPPFYPHPSHHAASGPRAQAASDPAPDSWDPPQIPERRFGKNLGLRSSSAVDDTKGLSRVFPGLQPGPDAPDESSRATAWTFLTDAPGRQPHDPAFDLYRHNFNSRSPGPPPAPDPGLDVAKQPSPTNSQNLDVPVCVQESDVVLASPHNLPSSPELVPSIAHPAPPASQPPPHLYFPLYLHGPAVSHTAKLHPSHQISSPTDYYYHYFQPEATADDQDLHPVSLVDSGKAQTRIAQETRAGRLAATAPSVPPCDCARTLGSCSYNVHDELVEAEVLGSVRGNEELAQVTGLLLWFLKDSVAVALSPACTVGQRLVLMLPDWLLDPAPAAALGPDGNASCSLEPLTSDPGLYAVPLLGCGVAKQVLGDMVAYLLQVRGFLARQLENWPVRLMVECRSSPGSPGEGRLHVMDPPPALVPVQLRVASDLAFSSFHPEAHLPLSVLRDRPLYLEVSLLDPPDPDLVLLVHSCLAHSPFIGWMPVYDGCSSRSDSLLLPVPHPDSHRIRRIAAYSFMSLPPGSPEDPEIYFLCFTEVCYSSDEDCTISCVSGPNSEQ